MTTCAVCLGPAHPPVNDSDIWCEHCCALRRERGEVRTSVWRCGCPVVPKAVVRGWDGRSGVEHTWIASTHDVGTLGYVEGRHPLRDGAIAEWRKMLALAQHTRDGLLAASPRGCINPDCAPFDPRSVAGVKGYQMPRRCIGADELRFDDAVPRGDEETAMVFASQPCDRACFTFVRATREEAEAAWIAANPERVASEPARRAYLALGKRATTEQRGVAIEAYTGKPWADACFVVEDWTRLAWCMWQAVQW